MGNPQKYRILTIRFRKSDKRESAILRVLEDLNLDIHKSVNQFVIDAVEYYIAHFDDKELIGPTSDAGKQRYISRVEMNRELQRIEDEIKAGKEEIRTQLYEDMLKLFIGSANMVNRSVIVQNEDTGNKQPGDRDTVQHAEEDESVIDDVMKWS